ncbi:MAG TPA: nicotinate phosphoribosyltransferase [Vicinamibacterales bacterium]|nr:nicotinate phosphoribosyltransferase [Vicinamibacterales bacterium]
MPVSALATDLYQLTMIAGYLHTGRHRLRATFELFTRRLPPHRNCLVFAGLDQALDYLQDLRFGADEVAWLAELPVFRDAPAGFFEYLRSFRFTGDVWAMAEGTPFLPNEPVLRISAPLAEAQLVETALLAILNLQTTIASKALRLVDAAGNRPVMDFGARRAHGIDAALYAARAAYLAGCTSTSFVEAGRRFGIPLSGTMAHSWILAAETERQAFVDYADLFGARTVLLLDTYDVAAAAEVVVGSGLKPLAVRLDSGDLLSLARQVRKILDDGKLSATEIIVSGDLDEWKIRSLVAAGAPIDTYAVGTALATSEDAPAMSGVYKLVEAEGPNGMRPVFKRSAGKSTRPGAKQVWRVLDRGAAVKDVVALVTEPPPDGGDALLQPVMRMGTRLAESPALADLRAGCAERIAMMPRSIRELERNDDYKVEERIPNP